MNKYRTLVDGKRVMESTHSVQMTIDSKCPKKWAFVDMETGDIWVHKSRYKHPGSATVGDFRDADRDALHMVRLAMTRRISML
jgi:hypothetical protein